MADGIAGNPNSPHRVAKRADSQFEPFLSKDDLKSTGFQTARKIARAEFEADVKAARAANDPTLMRLARDRYADFYAGNSPGFAAELSQARTLNRSPALSRDAQFLGLAVDEIVVTGSRLPRGVAIFPLVDPLLVEAGNITMNVGSAASAAIDGVPGGRLAVTLVDLGLTIGGGPVRYAVGKAYEAAKDGLISYATGRFAAANYGGDATAGGIGLPVVGSLLSGGISAGLKTLGVLGEAIIRNARLAGSNHPVTGVPFDSNGFPDFSGYATHTVQINQTGGRAADYRAANAAAGLRYRPDGYTWHHHQDGTTMQLVPTPLHSDTGHTGFTVTVHQSRRSFDPDRGDRPCGRGAVFAYDAVGRQTGQVDRDARGTAVYDRAVVLDTAGRVARETVAQRQGNATLTTTTTNDYLADGYALGAVKVASVATSRVENGRTSTSTATTTNGYDWYGGAVLSTTGTTSGGTTTSTSLAYDAAGTLVGVAVGGARPRTVSLVNDLSGQALARDESDAGGW